MGEERMSSAKNNVESLLRKLPDDCTLEDIQYHLYVLEKIQRGLEVADAQGTLTQEEVEQRLSKWITR
jgi:predicted transcriptional regulator